jgi:hypothetical protein
MRRRTFAISAFFAGIVAALRHPFARVPTKPAYVSPSIRIGLHRYVAVDGGWKEVPLDSMSWRDQVPSIDFFKYELKRGRGAEEDRLFAIKEEDYANLDLGQRQEAYRDNWLRERGLTAQMLDLKHTIIAERAWGSRDREGVMDPELVEDLEQLRSLQRECWAQARLNVLPRAAEGENT